jgi:hypothetical protein
MSRRNKRPIPPLFPSQTAVELLQANVQFSDLRAKLVLINKAHGSNSRGDLNDVISELRELFERDCCTCDLLRSRIYSKQQELSRLRDEFDRLYCEFDEFRNRTSIVTVIGACPDIAAKLSRLCTNAEEVEQARLRSQGAPFRRSPAAVMGAKEDDCHKFLDMTELNFALLESLVHLMKKNLLAMESCDGDIRTAKDLFGSVTGTVAAYHRLHSENMELRSAEQRFMRDAFLKRHPLQRVSIHGVRLMAQSLIQRLHDSAQLAGMDPTLGFDVDQVFPGPPDDQEESMATVQKQIAQLQETLQKMPEQDEIPIVQSDTPANVHMVQQLNESFTKIRQLILSISDQAAEASEIWRSVFSVQTEWHRFKRIYQDQVGSMRNFSIDHVQLLHRVEQNAAIIKSIYQTAAQLGRSLMAQSHRDSLFQWLKGVSLPDEEDQNFLTRPISALPSIPFYRKHRRNPHRYMKGLNVLVNGVHFEFVNALSVLFKIGKTIGLTNRDLEYLREVWPTFQTLLGQFKPMLESCKKELRRDILRVQQAEKIVLMSRKVSREIACDLVTWAESEVQAEETTKKSK